MHQIAKIYVVTLWFLFCALCNHQSVALPQNFQNEETSPSNPMPDLTHRVIISLDKAAHYYNGHFSILNLDGIFGAKVLEGQLSLFVAEYLKGFLSDTMDEIMKKNLSEIAKRSGRAVKYAIPHLQEEMGYYRHLRRMLVLPWDIAHSHRRIDKTLKWDDHTVALTQPLEFRERDSDNCMIELLEPTEGMMCSMSQKCQLLMTQPGQKGYQLTHQILYSIVSEMSGCGSRFEKWLVKNKRSGSIEQLQAEFCANLYPEALKHGNSTFIHNIHNKLDLLLEMQFVCGMLGYVDFIRKDWLEGTLELQNEGGCFLAAGPRLGRKLLVEERLEDGCLSHLTSVAVSALVVNLRFLLDPGPKVLSPWDGSKLPSPISPPSASLVPPAKADPFSIGQVVINQPLFREDAESGLSRVADIEKSLEDKVDIVLEHLKEEKRTLSVTHSLIKSVSQASESRQKSERMIWLGHP
ncbi:UPF0764 protein C16orf89 homolog isoform X2 [Oratosquilla oratoria]|uniref:UPF0764 protein C16orf89 homolog isoform X2 n=1 Tax=Oratosquilla oratoria TaxID=337810 RepID=UPI003F75E4CC